MMQTASDVQDFDRDVIEASHEQPVLVDFWAPWCAPCRQLGPVLERVAAETDRWRLVKVNTETHPGPARRYGVRGIPNVKLFVDGTVTDEFTGALPERAVRQWLAAHLPSEAKKRVTAARRALDRGDTATAERLLTEALADEPDHDEAKLLLAQTLVFRDPARAADLADAADVAAPAPRQMREAVQTVARLLRLRRAGAAPADALSLDDAPGAEAYRTALDALARGDFHAALDGFIEVVRVNRALDDDGARKACIALFTLLGPQHDATQAYRRTFDMTLY
jgi:putative thioredoxin